MGGIWITHRLAIDESELHWSFSRSGGPGGQNVNKVNSKATLRWRPPPDFLPEGAKQRLERLAARYLTVEGEIVLQSQEFRDQSKNIQRCREKLRALVLSAMHAPKPRVPTKPSRAVRQRRLDQKRRNAEKKGSRKWAP